MLGLKVLKKLQFNISMIDRASVVNSPCLKRIFFRELIVHILQNLFRLCRFASGLFIYLSYSNLSNYDNK